MHGLSLHPLSLGQWLYTSAEFHRFRGSSLLIQHMSLPANFLNIFSSYVAGNNDYLSDKKIEGDLIDSKEAANMTVCVDCCLGDCVGVSYDGATCYRYRSITAINDDSTYDSVVCTGKATCRSISFFFNMGLNVMKEIMSYCRQT